MACGCAYIPGLHVLSTSGVVVNKAFLTGRPQSGRWLAVLRRTLAAGASLAVVAAGAVSVGAAPAHAAAPAFVPCPSS